MTNAKAAPVAATAIDLDRFNAEMGRRVRVRRELLRLSVPDLAARTGLPAEVLSLYEAGEAMMPAAVVYSMTQALKVDLNFFWAETSPSPAPAARAGARIFRLVPG